MTPPFVKDKVNSIEVIIVTELKSFSTKELVKELRKREAVESLTVLPHQDYEILTNDNHVKNIGPVIILSVKD